MTNAEKQLKEMEEQMRREQASQKKEKQGRSAKPYAVKKESHPLASFLIGLVLLGAGIYWVLNSFVVSFSWGSLWGGFGMNTSLATGLMLVPLLIGIGLLFFLDRKWIGWGVVAMTPEERENPQILGASRKKRIAAGCGLVARGLLKSRD